MADNNGWGRQGSQGSQGWGSNPNSSGSGDDAPETRFEDSGDGETRFLDPGAGQDPAPVWGASANQAPPNYQHSNYQQPGYRNQPVPDYPEPSSSDGGRLFFLIAIPLLVIILVGALLMWKWDDFFGSDDADNAQAPQAAATESQESGGDDSNGSGSDEESTEAAESEGADSADSADSDAANGARPKEADLPAGSEPVNAAARNDEPAGNFNNIYKSPQVGDSYTSDDFAEAVRDAFVDAYLEDKEIDHVLDVYSDAARRSIEMTCRDAGSYVHCSGGNNANVYIA
jgi:hypothetical protein